MRVLQVIGAMDRGGAETMIMNLYRAIDRDRIQFDFLVHEQRTCDYDEEIADLGGSVFRELPRFTVSNARAYRKACRGFLDRHPEHAIVHGHIGSSALIYLPEARRAGRVAIAHSHARHFPLSLTEALFRALSLPVRFQADGFLACSLEAGIDRFGRAVVEGDRFSVLRNAIDVAAFQCDERVHAAVKDELGWADRVVVGHVGRFDPVKNHRFLIEAFARFRRRVPEALLVLVGRGALEDEVRAHAVQSGCADDVVFWGVTDDVARLQKAFDLFVFPSLSEGLAMSAIEAQAAGAPALLSTGVPELSVMDGRIATRLDLAQGPQAWADAMVCALERPLERASGAQAVRAAGFDITRTAAWLEEYYRRLAGESMEPMEGGRA